MHKDRNLTVKDITWVFDQAASVALKHGVQDLHSMLNRGFHLRKALRHIGPGPAF